MLARSGAPTASYEMQGVSMMNRIAHPRELQNFSLAGGSVQVASRSEASKCPHWANTFVTQAKDIRYYELVENTIHEAFDYQYFILRDPSGEVCGIQPFFILDLDLLAGTKPPALAI